MDNNEINCIINEQVTSKVLELSHWKQVRWEGGRLYYEGAKIKDEISHFSVETQILYFETLLDKNFIIQDNWPHEAPDITQELKNWIRASISKLKIKQIEDQKKFLNRDLPAISFDGLGLDITIIENLNYRIEEIKKCFSANAYLAVIILSGSTLEGVLLGLAQKNPKLFNQSKSAPKTKERDIKPLNNWTLDNFINVANDIGLLKEDVKKFSHSLREFRNYIHPNEQVCSGFIPGEETARICIQVLKLGIFELTTNNKQEQ